MAATHVALLRGINVGKAKRLAMADLRAVIESLGGSEVRTLLNSGNAVWSAKRALTGAALRQAVLKATGVDSRTTVLTITELATIMAEHPLRSAVTDETRFFCYIPATADDLARFEPLLLRNWAPEMLGVGSHAAYAWSPGGWLASKLFDHVSRTFGDAVTARNWATMRKLHAMVTPDAN